MHGVAVACRMPPASTVRVSGSFVRVEIWPALYTTLTAAAKMTILSFASTDGNSTIKRFSSRRRSLRAKMHRKTVTTMDLEGTQVTYKP